jgi:hypothetical protein
MRRAHKENACCHKCVDVCRICGDDLCQLCLQEDEPCCLARERCESCSEKREWKGDCQSYVCTRAREEEARRPAPFTLDLRKRKAVDYTSVEDGELGDVIDGDVV